MKLNAFAPLAFLFNEVSNELETVGAGAGEGDNNVGLEDAPAGQTAALIHTRDEKDYAVLAGAFNLDKIADLRKVVHGLNGESRAAIIKAAAKGTPIVSTGLPVDMAADIGEVTIIRAWNVEKADGSRSQGATPPAVYSVRKVADMDAYNALKTNPDFLKAFALGEAGAEDSPF